MKKVFKILSVLISAVLLTTFVSCSSDVPTGGTDFNPEDEIKITYNLNYEGAEPTVVTQYKGHNFNLQNFTREGFFLAGWAMTSEATDPEYQANQSVKFQSSKTLYAIWISDDDVVTLTLYTEGYYAGVKVEYKVPKGKKYSFPLNTATVEGKVFLGWSSSYYSTSPSYSDGDTITISRNTTYYAVWYDVDSPDLYSFTFDANDGSGRKKTQYTKKSTYSNYTLNKDVFERDGYYFEGWATTSDAADAEYDDDFAPKPDFFGTEGNEVKNKTLYAVWIPNSKLKIRFIRNNDKNDNTGVSILVDMKDNKAEFTFPKCTFEGIPDGYVFACWKPFSKANEKPNASYPGETGVYENDTVRKIVYKALKVKPENSFVKKLNYYYENTDGEKYTYYYDWSSQSEIMIFDDLFPELEGEFVGWRKDYSDKKPDPAYAPGTRIETFGYFNEVLYGCYSKDVTLTLHYGSETKQITVKSYQPVTLPKDTFSNGDKSIGAWGLLSGLSYDALYDVYKVNQQQYFVKDADLYPIWVDPIKMVFDSNGGDQETVTIDAYTYVETPCPVEFTRPGYIFKGFSTKNRGAAEFSGENSTKTRVSYRENKKTITYYAVWSKKTTIKMRSGVEEITPDFDIETDINTKQQMPNTSYVSKLGDNIYKSWSIPEGYVLKSWKIYAGDALTEEVIYKNDYLSDSIGGRSYLVIYDDTTAIEAVWNKPYIITFHSNYGEDETKQQIITSESSQKLAKNTFVREGYTFKGWSLNSDGSGYIYSDEYYHMYRNDAKEDFYAVWEKNN